MSEGILLPPVPRGTLLTVSGRLERLDAAVPQIRAALDGERDAVAIQAFPGHIACDALTRSELVVPITSAASRVEAVLDLDSPHLDAFCREEADRLVTLLAEVFASASF